MSSVLTEWSNTAETTTDYCTMFAAKMQEWWNWDDVEESTFTSTYSLSTYYGNGSSNNTCFSNIKQVIQVNFTYGNIEIQVTGQVDTSYDNRMALRIGSNGVWSDWFLIHGNSYRNYGTTVTFSNGFVTMLGRIKSSTETTVYYQPFYFGIAPTTNITTGTTTNAAFMVLPWNLYNGSYLMFNTVCSQNSTVCGRMPATKDYNIVYTLSAHKIYCIGNDDVVDGILHLERIPDPMFSYVGKVVWNNSQYYRLGHLLVPVEA